jgi:CheY-like chemotaxis protein
MVSVAERCLVAVDDSAAPVVLLIEPADAAHDHAALLRRYGFRVEAHDAGRVTHVELAGSAPSVIAIELDAARTAATVDLARRLREEPQMRDVPIILFATHLRATDIQAGASAGVMSLQIGPSDGLKLVGAIRGILSVGGGRI